MIFSKKPLLFILVPAILLIAGGTYFGWQWRLEQARQTAWKEMERSIHKEIAQFKGEVGIIIKDLRSGREFSYNRDRRFASASLAKIPLMGACFLAAEEGRVDLDRNIALKSSDKLTGSGVLKDMPAGTAFSVQRLIGLMIYDSDNTATNIITNLVGRDYLNNAFKVFGLKDTELSRKIADYHLRDRGIENYTTAQDMAMLLEKIYRRALGSRNISNQCISMLKLTRMNDRIPKYLPVNLTIAHKTGLEQSVCHDAGIVFAPKGDFVIVVLTRHSNGSSAQSKEFIARVSFYAYKHLNGLR